jgi:hypothetical protein
MTTENTEVDVSKQLKTLSEGDKRLLGITTPPPAPTEAAGTTPPPKEEKPADTAAAQPPKVETPKPDANANPPAEAAKPAPAPEEQPTEDEPTNDAAIALYEKMGEKLLKDAEYFKKKYEATQEQEYAEKYNSIVDEYNALKPDYQKALAAADHNKNLKILDGMLASGLKALPPETQEKFKGYIDKAIDITPYDGDPRSTASQIWKTANNLAQTEQLFSPSQPQANKPPSEPGKIFKEIGTPSGTSRNDNETTDWAKVEARAKDGDREAIRKLMARNDPFYKEMGGK